MNELFANFRTVDEDFFEELEETLIGADVGFDTAIRISESLRQEVKLRNAKKPAGVQNAIIEKLVNLYEEEGMDPEEVQNSLIALVELAQLAESQGQTLFVWIRLLQD